MNPKDFFAELKRRNVIRFAGLYLVGAWLLVQVSSTVLPMFGAPDWLPRSIVILLATGFFPALIFSWVFEMTPQGLKRDEDVPPEQSIAPQTARRMDRMIIVVLLLALVYFAVDKFVLNPRREKFAAKMPAPESNAAPNEKSVAVLAFANLSDDKGSEYFSDGISEELLTVLQKIPGLHVAARTSAFSFKGKNAPAQEIGQKLGVTYLVEGSVRKADNMVRIAARLTHANTGEEQWSENYTRDLKDVFAVQTELAQTIVGQLRGRFAGTDSATKEKIQAEVQAAEKGGTKNVEAHESYLQGRFFLHRHSEKEVDQARAAYEHAVELDPGFALAWAGLAQTHVWYCNYASQGGQKEFNAHLSAAREAVQRALSFESDLPDALYARAMIQTNFDYDWKGAAETLRKALALAPQDAALLTEAGNLAGARGESREALGFMRRSVALDPVNAQARAFLGGNLLYLGYREEARAEYKRVIELNPSAPFAHAGVGQSYLLEGKFEEAAAAAQQDAAEWARLLIVSCARWGQKRVPESDTALAELIAKTSETAAYQVAEVYAYRNDRDKAFEWLERAHRQNDAGMPGLRLDTLFPNLHGDPRWDALLRTLGLADDQLK
jgi:TolB-like protein/tetratricopeptide (TPR) repeat protein